MIGRQTMKLVKRDKLQDNDENYESLKAMNLEEFSRFIETEKIEASELNFKRIKIYVSSGRLNSEGMFSSNYISYNINVESGFVKLSDNNVITTVGWTIHRKDVDFYYLRKHMVKMFPYKAVPPLPPKKKKTTLRFIRRREKFFTSFL